MEWVAKGINRLQTFKIFLEPHLKIEEQYRSYTLISFLAELGGYGGIFLGFSVSDVACLILGCIVKASAAALHKGSFSI